MNFDLRLPIGMIFTLFGVILTAYGLMSDPAVYKKSLGININLGWGVFLLVFGILMLIAALRGRKNGGTPPPA